MGPVSAISGQQESDFGHIKPGFTDKHDLGLRFPLPAELIDQIFGYLEVHDRLALRLVCRRTYTSIARPGLVYKHEVAPVARHLKRDRFNKACEHYRACPDPRVLPCARCMMFHPLRMFFDAQIEQRHEERSCKAVGVITACPCKPFTWGTLISAISLRRDDKIWRTTHCTCRLPRITLEYTTVELYLPRFIWATPKLRRNLRVARYGCVKPRPYNNKDFSRGQKIGMGLILTQYYKWSGVDEAALLLDPGLAASVLRDADFPICPHIDTASEAVVQMLRRFKPNQYCAGVFTSKGSCVVKNCQTSFKLHFSDEDVQSQGYHTFLTVVKDLGRIRHQAGPLSNKAFLAQAIMPVSGNSIHLVDTGARGSNF